MLELGPGAGERGGRVVHAGPVAAAAAVAHRAVPHRREAHRACRACAGRPGRAGSGSAAPRSTTSRASTPTSRSATLTAVTGVSGLRQEHAAPRRALPAASRRRLHGGHSAKSHLGEPVGQVASLTGWELLQDVLLVDQSPIGRSPALQSDHLHQGVRRDPRAVRRPAARRGSGSTRRPPSPSTCPAAAATPARARGTCRSRWSSWPTSSCRARSAAARAIEREVLDVRIQGTRSTTSCSGRWTRRSPASGTSRSSAPRSGSCSRSGSATCGWASRPPRSPAARRSGSRSRAS